MSYRGCRIGGVNDINPARDGVQGATREAQGILTRSENGGPENEVLDTVLGVLRLAKGSPRPEISAAARRWEGRFAFRIKVEEQRGRRGHH